MNSRFVKTDEIPFERCNVEEYSRMDINKFYNDALISVFSRLSSGHKIILTSKMQRGCCVRMEEKILKLKEKLSKFETQDLLGMISTRLMTFGNC